MWNGESTIKERQPDIFLLATHRVENYIEFGTSRFKWNSIFIRTMHDWEIESMAHLLEDIYYDFCNFFFKKRLPIEKEEQLFLAKHWKVFVPLTQG